MERTEEIKRWMRLAVSGDVFLNVFLNRHSKIPCPPDAKKC